MTHERVASKFEEAVEHPTVHDGSANGGQCLSIGRYYNGLIAAGRYGCDSRDSFVYYYYITAESSDRLV